MDKRKRTQIPGSNNIYQNLEPYIGPRPFRREGNDQSRFFGRNFETDEIVSLIISHRLILVYAQSGTGKTSIFNAQVIPTLETHGFEVLPMARVQTTSVTGTRSSSKSNREVSLKIENLYVYNTIQSLLQGSEGTVASILELTLFEFLDSYFPNKKDKKGELKPQVLVIDQLEEIFSSYPDKWIEQQSEFFGQIADSLENNPTLRIVFIIREDYLAQLDPFKNILPERLRPSFRLQQLTRSEAILAIKGPIAKIIRTLGDDEKRVIESQINELVKNLLKIHVEVAGGSSREVEGEFVEPIQLQVVCRRWWHDTEGVTTGGKKALNPPVLNVDQALQEYFDEAIKHASEETGIYQGDIRVWCEKKLITSSGTRNLVHREHRYTGGLPNRVLTALESNYLIRAGSFAGAKWYELTHDRLIKPLVDSNAMWKKKLQSELRIRNRLRKVRDISVVFILIAIGILAGLVGFMASPDFNPYQIRLNHAAYEVISQSWNVDTENAHTIIYAVNTDNDTISILYGPKYTHTDDIKVGKNPTSISINRNEYNPTIYVTNSGSDTVSVIDHSTNTLVNDIKVGSRPSSLVFYAGMLYVANSGSDTVSVVNGTTNTLVTDIEVGKHPTSVEVGRNYEVLYVANSGSGTISIVNLTTNTLVSNINTNSRPSHIASFADKLYVASSSSNEISKFKNVNNSYFLLDTLPINSTVSDIGIGRPLGDLAVVDVSGRAYTTGEYPNSTSSIFNLDPKPSSLYYDGHLLYVTNPDRKIISIIDPHEPISPSSKILEYLIIVILVILGLVGLLYFVMKRTKVKAPPI